MNRRVQWTRVALACTCCVALTSSARAQVFVAAPGNVPSGAPGNQSNTEQVDFADVDLDGDWDAGFADGGDVGNDQNRLWINAGGAQAGTLGVFVDETLARWVGLGGPGSSVPPALVLGSGGYISFPQEHAFADLDGDGDLDLIAAAVGVAFGGREPTRVFLNDGLGSFSEFNPSGFQLGGTNLPDGSPGLWAQGAQQHGTSDTSGQFCDVAVVAVAVDAADLEGDFDLDVLLLDRNDAPRMVRNLSELGPWPCATSPG